MSKNASQRALQLYLKEIEKNSIILTPKEERELAKRIEKGDEEAKKKLARANLMLVVKIAKYYIPQSKELDILDLIQEGNLALYHATGLYDWRSDYRFSSFAILVIEMGIRDALANKGEAALRNLIRKGFRKAFEELAKKEKKKEFVKPRSHVLYYSPKEERKIKYTPEEKIAQILKIKNYIQENISETVKLLLVTKMFSKEAEAKEEIKRILE